jgi:hypothetical protein
LYYDQNSASVWEAPNDKANVRMTIDASGCWGRKGLFFLCDLRFQQLQELNNGMFGDGKAFVICPHISVANHGGLKRFEHEAQEQSRMASMQLRQGLIEAHRYTKSKTSARRAQQPYQSDLYNCYLCPTDFQLSVNDQAEVVVYVWRFLGDSVNSAIISAIGLRHLPREGDGASLNYPFRDLNLRREM